MVNEKKQVLVSAIMPTYNRRAFIPYAIQYFLRQDYENKELVIIDDGTDNIQDLIPATTLIRYYRLHQKLTLGEKLNLACKYARGNIIANWDDDDWYAPRRLSYQVAALQNEPSELCGINKLLYYDPHKGKAYQYIYPASQRVWLLGSSLCYTRELWNRNQFAHINIGMDGLFVWGTSIDRIKVLEDPTFAVHMIHGQNVSPKRTTGAWWHNYPITEIKKILQADWKYYSVDGFISSIQNMPQPGNLTIGLESFKDKKLKNVYACLVHENECCVIDLVRNLHYLDPNSIILLYNGGNNPDLLKGNFPFSKFGAVIQPNPVPMQHGYLHPFALSCMEFALENFTFDFLTIVDSDQLGIRPGYSSFLSGFLNANTGIGMLSNCPERVAPGNKLNHIALQAFKEFDLWKPFLDGFAVGESKFVHWSFWPSTVFTLTAIQNLVKVFKENKLLQQIMKHTKIWASEEIILPTVVALLGYKIAANPCSYTFVKYRKVYDFLEVENAFENADAYWIHPVKRMIDDPFRKYIREKFNNYSCENISICGNENSTEEIFNNSLIGQLKEIDGWLSDQEAKMLIAKTKTVCKDFSILHAIVEIGSYQGKSTVLFGSVVKKNSPGTKLVAIDMHDGKLGDADRGLDLFPPSFEIFKKNIEKYGLSEIVEPIKNYSFNVKWSIPISLLFVDGLHDYRNVSRDFLHFSNWIVPGGYVAFHDYASYFPGVKKLVDELLAKGAFKKIDHIESLVILQKL